MLPSEINLPSNVQIFEPNTENLKPLNKKQIKEILSHSPIIDILREEPILIIINDHHRSTPSHKILAALAEIIPDHKISGVVIASGTHEPPSQHELENILHGTDRILGIQVLTHSATESDFYELGITERGTRVKMNRILENVSQVLCINSVEPHFFAGYTGGIKSIVPGLAHRSTVEKNHSWALSPDSGPTKLIHNPIQLDLWEAGEMINVKKMGIQMVSVGEDIFHISSGELRSSFEEAVRESNQIFTTQINHQFDLILSVVYPPLDRSLYQAQKGIENTRSALKKGGKMLLFAKCGEGIGNRAFYETIVQFDNPDEVLKSINIEQYKFGDHKVYKFATLAKQSELILITDLSEMETKNVFAQKLDVNQLQEYLFNLDRSMDIAVVLDSGTMVLRYEEDE